VARIAVAGMLLLLVAACGGTAVDDGHGDAPQVVGHAEPTAKQPEPPPLRLSREQLERYYVAQTAWGDCATAAGIVLSEPPPLEDFLAGGGEWWVGADLSDDEWNRLQGDESGSSGLDLRCGEPPLAFDFAVGREALERLYAWQLEVVRCVEAEGFPLDGPIPLLDEFVRTGGTSWEPAREFTARYGFPEGAVWERLANRCGSPTGQDLWLGATDFEVDRPALVAQYEANLALTACLEGAGLTVPAPPPLEEFVDQLGWNWTHADIWAAVYRDNDRRAVRTFADRLDQACPGGS
jgi:hypothetical protein